MAKSTDPSRDSSVGRASEGPRFDPGLGMVFFIKERNRSMAAAGRAYLWKHHAPKTIRKYEQENPSRPCSNFSKACFCCFFIFFRFGLFMLFVCFFYFSFFSSFFLQFHL